MLGSYLGKMSGALFGVGAGLVLKKAYDNALDKKVRQIVPNPLPDSALFKSVVLVSECKRVADKPKGELSGEIVEITNRIG